MLIRSIASLACTVVLATASLAQMAPMNHEGARAPDKSAKPLASPVATAEVTLNGKYLKITYNRPSMRGRKIMGELVPYDKVWRTGANEATTLITKANLKIGTLSVPAGTYTLFTLPSADTWQLIVSKDTGEWGLAYKEASDLGRTPMQNNTLSAPQEKMSISFENTKGNSTELHVKWDTTDRYVNVTAE
ncbi:MAG: DUF2911 domain-containing protein [Edaphobacter sp.]